MFLGLKSSLEVVREMVGKRSGKRSGNGPGNGREMVNFGRNEDVVGTPSSVGVWCSSLAWK